MRSRVAIGALVALTACFERGGGPAPGRDASAPAAAGPDLAGWLVRDPDGALDPAATVTVALEAEPATLDPFAAGDLSARRVLGDVYEGLLCLDPADQLEPCLAERYQVSEDRTTWRFWLRPARFHDGRPVTVADVVASVRAPGQGAAATGPLAAVLDELTAIETPGDREVVLRFAAARPGRARELALLPIAPADAIAAGTLATAPVGTGPLRFVGWRRGEVIELARWDGYRGPPAAAATVRYRITADRAEALRLLAAGAVDLALQVPVEQAVRFAAEHDQVVRFRYELPALLVAVYNTRRPALADPAHRRALTALLDRPGLARSFLGGARVLSGPWPGGPAPVPFDRALAARLLGAARPRLELLVPQGSTTSARLADVWAADARGLATLEVRAVPFGDLLARLAAHDFDLAVTSMSGGPDVDWWSRFAGAAPADQAWSGLADPELDRLLDAHRRAPDEAVRAAAAAAVHARLDALQPFAFITVDTRAGLARRDVRGLLAATVGPPRGRLLGKAR